MSTITQLTKLTIAKDMKDMVSCLSAVYCRRGKHKQPEV